MNIPQQIATASTLLNQGKLVAIPTETVYGLGADASNPIAIQKIYWAKNRPATNPLIIHLPNADAIHDWAQNIPQSAWVLANAFWPGPLTLILQRNPQVSTVLTAGQESIALRVPDHSLTLALLEHFGRGIAAPSANRSGRISPTTAADVREELGDRVDYILDGGPCRVGIESTIVSLIEKTPVILREGSISAAALSTVLGTTILNKKTLDLEHIQKNPIIVPGSDLSHYAPTQPLYLLEKNALYNKIMQCARAQKLVSVLSFSRQEIEDPCIIQWVSTTPDPAQYAQALYKNLRALDKTQSSCILVERPPNKTAWDAIVDRLERAAS
jgi:L-threonylcarbamoyladenylate synthase